MSMVYMVTGTNRRIKNDAIFELNVLGMYPTRKQAEDRMAQLTDVGDFDMFNVSEFQVGAGGSSFNVPLI